MPKLQDCAEVTKFVLGLVDAVEGNWWVGSAAGSGQGLGVQWKGD